MDIVGRILGNDDLRQWEMNVDSIFLHSDFVSKSPYSDDLALIKLSHPVPNSTTVQPITLPSTTSSKFPSLGQLCVTKGWGCTELG
ncbi:hypothetical protein RRG08_003602 [Elysia crispata]|uniref:Peptidase S1 domain-containing protein n=1 Tax=Elysia crispata TaxID=231223 RepID=A0AAE1DGR8_9GAST|nr:hypothetical protein RRG08_003602 [Elysia crispata]